MNSRHDVLDLSRANREVDAYAEAQILEVGNVETARIGSYPRQELDTFIRSHPLNMGHS
jgi:hypothetical protein